MHPGPRICWSVLALVLVSAGCATTASGPASSRQAAAPSPSPVLAVGGSAGSSVAADPADSADARVSAQPVPSASGSSARGPLSGEVIGIDPGHNGRNGDDPAFIGSLIWNGVASETCDTSGTETDAGYTEAQFNFNVASYLRADLRADGARVVLTRSSNEGVGPCVTTRAEIIDRAHADVAIDIHADGGPASGRGFTVIEPVADGSNDTVIGASVRFGADVKAAMLAGTSMPPSDYYGAGGIIFRTDLAGLNLTTVPKILIECGNMRNATDAALLTQPRFQRLLARVMTAAIVTFLRRR